MTRGGFVFVLAVLAFSLLWQGSRGLLEPDEGRYAEIAREMLASGDWIVPRLAGETHFDKPPLTYWLTAAGLAVLGCDAWGARALLGLATGLTALLTGLIARRFCAGRAFRTGTVVHLVAFGPFLGGAILTTDAYLALFETLAVLGFVEAWAGGPHHRRWAAVMGIGFGLAFLTKGPPGLLPLAAIGVFALARGRARPEARRRLWSPWGALAGLAIGLGWFAAVTVTRPGLAGWFLSHEVVARVASTELHRNNTALIYPLTLAAGFLPWTVVLPPLAGGWRRFLSGLWERLRRPGDDRVLFLVLWVLVPLIVFAMSKSRLPLYVLPLFVPLAVGATAFLCGPADETRAGAWARGSRLPLLGAEPGRWSRTFVRTAVGMAAGLLLLKVAAAWWVPWAIDMRPLAREVHRIAPDGYAIVVGDEPLDGLRFYRDGELTNWDPRDGTPAPGFIPALWMERQAVSFDGHPRVFIARRNADWMDPAFREMGMRAVATVRGRKIYVMKRRGRDPVGRIPPAGTSDGRARG